MAAIIVLVQHDRSFTSRTFYDYPSAGAAAAGIANIFEQRLRIMNPGLQRLTYSAGDLKMFIDSLHDVDVLVYDAKQKVYVPYAGKVWLKEEAIKHMARRVGGR